MTFNTKKKLKVLFVCSGRGGRVGDVVRNQGESLKKAGISLDYFTVNSGLWGYFSAIFRLRNKFRKGNYDIVHAHYIYSGLVAGFAFCSPLVVSFMGSDTYMSKFMRLVTRYFVNKKWDAVIVKTEEMKESLNIPNAYVIPNGVDLERFRPMPRELARQQIELKGTKKLIILIAIMNREEKNINLAYESLNYLEPDSFEFRHVHDVPNSEIPYWLNAADVMLLTSKREGSVNVVKEAMACNCPIVATDVGDVRKLTENIKGCFIASFNPKDIAGKIIEAMSYGKRTNSRERILDLKLDSVSVAAQVENIYKKVSFSRNL